MKQITVIVAVVLLALFVVHAYDDSYMLPGSDCETAPPCPRGRSCVMAERDCDDIPNCDENKLAPFCGPKAGDKKNDPDEDEDDSDEDEDDSDEDENESRNNSDDSDDDDD